MECRELGEELAEPIATEAQKTTGGRTYAETMYRSSISLHPLHLTLDSIKPLYPDILVVNRAVRIMALERKSAFAQFSLERLARLNAGRFVVFENLFAVDDNGDRFVFHDDFLSPPFVIGCEILSNIDHVIEAAGFLPVGVSVIDLAFEAGAGPVGGLVFGMEIDATV